MKQIINSLFIAILMCISANAQSSWDASTSTFISPESNYMWDISINDSRINWINKTPHNSSTSMLVNGGGILVRVSTYDANTIDAWEFFDDVSELVEQSIKSRFGNINGFTYKASNFMSSKSLIAGTHAVMTMFTLRISGYGEEEIKKAIDYTFYHSSTLYSLEIIYNTYFSDESILNLFSGFRYLL